MQLKPIAAIAVLLLMVASLLVSGCTTSVTNTTISPSSTSADMTTKLNNAFAAQDFIIVSPFIKATNQYGNVVYTGVVKDGEKTLNPYVHNFTIEEVNSRNQSISRFNAYVAQALKQGYPPSTLNLTGVYYSQMGADVYPAREIGIRINEPNSGLLWPYQSGGNGINFSDPNYTVVVANMTKA